MGLLDIALFQVSVPLSRTGSSELAEQVIATLRAHGVELREGGVRRLLLFGSIAWSDA